MLEINQKLKRRKFLGIKCKCVGRIVSVASILCNKCSFQAEDIILEINSQIVDSIVKMKQILKKFSEDTVVCVKIIRNSKIRIISTKLISIPYEQFPNIETCYLGFEYNDNLFRIITTSKGKLSVLKKVFIFIQGIECQSIDFPFQENHPYRNLLYGLTDDIYSTVRIDLYGNGDSQGNPCDSYSFQEIVNVYSSLVSYLYEKGYRIYLFGYSIGGVIAPVIVNELPELIEGIVVFDTILDNLYTYLIKNKVRQEFLAGIDRKAILQGCKEYSEVLDDLLVNRKHPNEILLQNPQFRTYFTNKICFMGHIYSYAQQIYDLDINKLWMNIKLPTCIIVGEKDYTIDYDEHIKLYNTLATRNHVRLISSPIDHYFEEDGEFSENTLLNIRKATKELFED